MQSKELTTASSEPKDQASTQVEVTLPVRRHRCEGAPQSALSEPGQPQIPRITRLMALAIKFQSMVDRGEVRDYADIARLGYVSRARLTQIMNLLLLAPGVREEGFEYDGHLHRSLSSAVREATGTPWNGFAFFGLGGKPGRKHGSYE